MIEYYMYNHVATGVVIRDVLTSTSATGSADVPTRCNWIIV